MSSTYSTPKPKLTYQALVGYVLQHQRKRLKLEQGVFATQIGISQSAFSRIESGSTAASVSQLRKIAPLLAMKPSEILGEADRLASDLERQGVEVLAEKEDSITPAAAMLGLGLLVALLSSR